MPMDLASTVLDAEIRQRVLPFLLAFLRRALRGAAFVEPGGGRVVVVRARIGDRVSLVVVRQERRRLRIGAGGELEQLHAGEAEAVAQRRDLRSARSEILGDESGGSERFEELRSRRRSPAAV